MAQLSYKVYQLMNFQLRPLLQAKIGVITWWSGTRILKDKATAACGEVSYYVFLDMRNTDSMTRQRPIRHQGYAQPRQGHDNV